MSEERKIENIVEYLEKVSKIKDQWPNSVLAFRGQENEEWPLASSAERRLKANITGQDKVPDQLFVEYHEDLLGRCKLKNYDKRENNQLDELDLLADFNITGLRPAFLISRAMLSLRYGLLVKNLTQMAKCLPSTRLMRKHFWR